MIGNVVTADLKVGGIRTSYDVVTGDDDAPSPPANPRFTIGCADHAEYLVLEAAAARIANRRAKGILRMYSEHYPCASCRDVIRQFLGAFPRMEIELGYTHGEPAAFTPDPVNRRIEITHIAPPDG